jgi:large subunit ribosomal protein L35
MPKMKSSRAAAKRFKKTGSGHVKHASSGRRHMLINKTPKQKRQLRGMRYVSASDMGRIEALLP